MGNVIGRGRYARETYPSTGGAAGAAAAALRNRNVAGPLVLVAPFVPATNFVAALLYTPRVSGVVQVTATLILLNGVTADTYTLEALAQEGTGLSVSGGAVSSNGWIAGSTVPPVIGGALGSVSFIGAADASLASNANGSVSLAAAVSQPLPIGVPVVIEIGVGQFGGGHQLAGLAFSSLSIIELP